MRQKKNEEIEYAKKQLREAKDVKDKINRKEKEYKTEISNQRKEWKEKYKVVAHLV